MLYPQSHNVVGCCTKYEQNSIVAFPLLPRYETVAIITHSCHKVKCYFTNMSFCAIHSSLSTRTGFSKGKNVLHNKENALVGCCVDCSMGQIG